MNILMIDELSTVSSNLWTNTDWRLGEIFRMIPEKAFAGLSIMTVADLEENFYFHEFLIRLIRNIY